MTARNEELRYGAYKVESERQGRSNRPVWRVVASSSMPETTDFQPIEVGTNNSGKKKARVLAAVLDKLPLRGNLPPDEPVSFGSAGEWEEWAAESSAVPARVAAEGKAAVAGYLYAVNDERPGRISNDLGVSESTVSQYLSDLRAGRR